MSSNEKKYFTLYWLTGKREFVSGNTIAEACTAAGYSNGAIPAMDMYKEGVDDSYYWDGEQKQWVSREAIHIHQQNLSTFTEVELVGLLYRHGTIILEFENKDQLLLHSSYGCFGFGDLHGFNKERPFHTKWVKYLEVSYGEYNPEGYAEDDKPCYMMTGGQYFHHDDTVNAITCFVTRGMDETAKAYKVKTMEGTVSLDEIAERQETIPL